MPNMSPSWIRFFSISFSSSRVRGVSRKSQVQVVDEEQEHAAGGVVGRPVARQDDAFLHRRRRRRLHAVGAAAVNQLQRRDVLLDAVLVDLDLSGLEIRDELVAGCRGR